MLFTIYKTTNLINGRFYIGAHQTDNPNDDYLGSGKALKCAIRYYGTENFKKEVLYIYDNAKDMYDKEAEIINEDFIDDPLAYNIKYGGKGGLHGITYIMPEERRKKSLKQRGKIHIIIHQKP